MTKRRIALLMALLVLSLLLACGGPYEGPVSSSSGSSSSSSTSSSQPATPPASTTEESLAALSSTGAFAAFAYLDPGANPLPLTDIVQGAMNDGLHIFVVYIPNTSTKRAEIFGISNASSTPVPYFGTAVGLYAYETDSPEATKAALESLGYQVTMTEPR